MCVWTEGQTPSRLINITHPGICDPVDSPKCNFQTWISCSGKKANCSGRTEPGVLTKDIRFPRWNVRHVFLKKIISLSHIYVSFMYLKPGCHIAVKLPFKLPGNYRNNREKVKEVQLSLAVDGSLTAHQTAAGGTVRKHFHGKWRMAENNRKHLTSIWKPGFIIP